MNDNAFDGKFQIKGQNIGQNEGFFNGKNQCNYVYNQTNVM